MAQLREWVVNELVNYKGVWTDGAASVSRGRDAEVLSPSDHFGKELMSLSLTAA